VREDRIIDDERQRDEWRDKHSETDRNKIERSRGEAVKTER